MMKRTTYGVVLLLIFLQLHFSGCELVTDPPSRPDFPRASNLVINEVFTLPLSHPSTYSWIEFYNPTGDTIDLVSDWKLTFASTDTANLPSWTVSLTTNGYKILDTVWITIDSTGKEISRVSSSVFVQNRVIAYLGYGVFDVPFGSGNGVPGIFGVGFRIPPNGLFTIVNNESRLEDHTRWGPADELLRLQPFFFTSVDTVDTIGTIYVKSRVDTTQDSLAIRSFKVIGRFYTVDILQPIFFPQAFYIQPKEQLVLKDPSGRIVDVVRMGDSVYRNVMGDSSRPILSAANRSVGSVPEFESIARYAGGYFTGNTASDFYITRPGLRPIPHWYSQLIKR